jgi:MFS family permease
MAPSLWSVKEIKKSLREALVRLFEGVYGLGAPFAGAIVDRVRRKASILAGLHFWSLICMATAVSRNFRHLFLFRAAEGQYGLTLGAQMRPAKKATLYFGSSILA